MSLDAQLARVQQAEHHLQAQTAESLAHWQQLKTLWRSSWTPTRIVLVGLAAGFATGSARPLRLASSGGLLNLLRALAPLLETPQSAPVTTASEKQA